MDIEWEFVSCPSDHSGYGKPVSGGLKKQDKKGESVNVESKVKSSSPPPAEPVKKTYKCKGRSVKKM